MDLELATPALFFPAISLLLLAYTNRFLAIAALIRTLHDEYIDQHDESTILQINNLRYRVRLIKHMQFCGVFSILFCAVCMLLLFIGYTLLAKWIFLGAVILLLASLGLSAWEIQLSTDALEIDLADLSKEAD